MPSKRGLIRKTVTLDPACDRMIRLIYSLLVKVDYRSKVSYSHALNTLLMGAFYYRAFSTAPPDRRVMDAVTGWLEGRTPEEEDFRKFEQHIQDLHYAPEAQRYMLRLTQKRT